MRAHDIRGCSLAIVKDTRLVYARGYTVAEPGYPPSKETTLFRQASVSKLFVAAAIYRLIQLGTKTPNGSAFTLDTTMQSVLNLTSPPKYGPPVDQFKDITIRHLLESISSINQDLVWGYLKAASDFGAPLPCTAAQLASFIAAQPLGTKKPGDTTNVNYGNTDYFMLSQVVAKLAGTASFEEALTKLVLKPLQITRVRGSRTLQGNQAADEARYHNVNIHPAPVPGELNKYHDDWLSLWWAPSSMSNDQPLLPHQYGDISYELLDGCGGLSAAVTDVARLLAAMNVRDKQGVFSEATLASWFENTVQATLTNNNPVPHSQVHGYHGFDGGWRVDPAKPAILPGNFTAGKGGWLPSHASGVEFVSGGLSYIIAINSVGQSDVKVDWLRNLDGQGEGWQIDPESVMGVAQAHDWGTIDLFPAYGMPSFTPPKKPLQVSPIDLSKLPPNAFNLLNGINLERATITAALKRTLIAKADNSSFVERGK